jgi:predicted PurR-regulated permease PerM
MKTFWKIIKNTLLFIALLIVSVSLVELVRGSYFDSDVFANLIIGTALAVLLVFVWQKISKRYLEKKEKLILPVVILLASIILGGFYYATQINKQKSIEKQEKEAKEEKERVEALELLLNKTRLEACLSKAEDNYWNYMELNGTGKRDDKNGISAHWNYWDNAEKVKKEASDICFKKYPQ